MSKNLFSYSIRIILNSAVTPHREMVLASLEAVDRHEFWIMRIEYENKFSDILLFSAVHQFLSPALQGLYLFFFAFIYWAELSENSISSAFLIAFYWYIGLWIFQFIFNAIYLFSRKNHSVLTKHIVEVRMMHFSKKPNSTNPFFIGPEL